VCLSRSQSNNGRKEVVQLRSVNLTENALVADLKSAAWARSPVRRHNTLIDGECGFSAPTVVIDSNAVCG
jgi:hypothetical protein